MIKYLYESGLSITITSPQQILEWASRYIFKHLFIGEIYNAHTINYKTGIPVEKGLFCEKIFGPIKNWTCNCTILFKTDPTICTKCGKELNVSTIRKYRMSFITLKIPIVNPWFIKTSSSILPILLNMSKSTLDKLLFYTNYPITKDIFSHSAFLKINNIQYFYFHEYLFKYLKNRNILEELITCKTNLITYTKKFKKIYFLNLFFINNIQLSWIFLEYFPIISPTLRPITKLNLSTYILSSINKDYQNIIINNNNLYKYNFTNTNILFILSKKRLLQQSIIKFFNLTFISTSSTPKSLITSLLGKYGRFRFNVLGKRIDFSGRSVIIVGPDLLSYKIGIPIIIAFSLYKSLLSTIIKKNLTIKNLFLNISNFTYILIKRLLLKILATEIILLNRAPTLHRFNIQAFKPYLIEGFSIKLHPLACKGFNADFDGDQMSIFLSLTKSSRLENKFLIASEKNLNSPISGNIMYKLQQSMILGFFTSFLINFTNYYMYMYFKHIEDILHLYTQQLLYNNTKLVYKTQNIYTYTTLNTLINNLL